MKLDWPEHQKDSCQMEVIVDFGTDEAMIERVKHMSKCFIIKFPIHFQFVLQISSTFFEKFYYRFLLIPLSVYTSFLL